MNKTTQRIQACRNILPHALGIAHVSAQISSRVALPALTCPRSTQHVRKFTGTREEICVLTCAISRGNKKQSCTRAQIRFSRRQGSLIKTTKRTKKNKEKQFDQEGLSTLPNCRIR